MSVCVYLLCREVYWPAKTVSAVLLRLGVHVTEQEKGSLFRGHGVQVLAIHVRQRHAWPDCTTLLCRTINIYIKCVCVCVCVCVCITLRIY